MKRSLVLLATALLAMATNQPLPVIAHNDGAAERLRVGQRAAFIGIYVGNHGTWIGNYIPEPPERGAKADPNADKDFVCAELLIPVTENHRLFRLETKRVIATGTVREVRSDKSGRCPLTLDAVTVRPR
jgi:hypothetical protein